MFKPPDPKPGAGRMPGHAVADPAQAVPSDRQYILLIGMHRSGTSLFARLINRLGAYIGRDDELVPAHPKINPTGYFERADLVIEHERFLQAQGCDWNRIGHFDLSVIKEPAIRALRDKLDELCAGIDSNGAPLVLKDPRMCLLLPVWHGLLEAPVHVFAVRDPSKIADSLLRSFPDMFTAHFLLAMWQKYLTSALRQLIGKPVLFISYEQLIASPDPACARLARGLRAMGVRGLRDLGQVELNTILDRNLDRSDRLPHALLTPARAVLQEWLLQQCAAEDPIMLADLPQLVDPDAELIEFERVREEYARRGYLIATRQPAAAAR